MIWGELEDVWISLGSGRRSCHNSDDLGLVLGQIFIQSCFGTNLPVFAPDNSGDLHHEYVAHGGEGGER